jgi:phosphoglycerate dehydrogenase-like enzyme
VLQYAASAAFRRSLANASPDWLDVAVQSDSQSVRSVNELRDAEVLLHVLTPVSAAVIASAPRLRLIQKIGVGINAIDLDAAKSRGIAVANMPGTNSQAVAEHTLALMLAALRRVPYFDHALRVGEGWGVAPDTFDTVGEISGRVVGFLGYGAVPRRLTPALLGLGAQVIYHARDEAPADGACHVPSFEALLAQADIVSLHVPLTADTQKMFDARTIGLMKPGSVLINTARGELIDEPALARALREGRVRAAGLDVFETEPADPASELLALPNVVGTPHIAWLTPQTIERSIGVIVENCRRLRSGEPLLHRV